MHHLSCPNETETNQKQSYYSSIYFQIFILKKKKEWRKKNSILAHTSKCILQNQIQFFPSHIYFYFFKIRIKPLWNDSFLYFKYPTYWNTKITIPVCHIKTQNVKLYDSTISIHWKVVRKHCLVVCFHNHLEK